ncbi:unnamed protein product [Parnassius mnemosyne]|uniref:115 kDa protein in type-1 retrotransposable element R1DM n=1 Tax=Parnassius mnemosyne TaxID=213953 RepID=A0AAV1L0L8_9NEOP
MFGIRTPAKRIESSAKDMSPQGSPTKTEKAGPSPKNQRTLASSVRRSIGEWETGKLDIEAGTHSPPKKVIPTARQRQKTMPSHETKGTTRKALEEAKEGSPKTETAKYADRLTEARACLHKAKLHLNNSRNLRTDIKTEVTQAIERLYQLVKEAETGKSTGKERDLMEQEKREERLEDEYERKKSEEHIKLMKKLEEHGKLLEENNKEIEKLRVEMKKHENKEERVTYASILAGKSNRLSSENMAMHSVAITSTDEKETGDQVIDRIRKAINAKEEGLKIDKIRKARDRKVIVGCCTQEEINRVKERIKNASEHLNVDDIKNKDPLVILKDVLQYNSDEEIVKAIRVQNTQLFKELQDEEDRIEIKYKKKTRNPHTSHIVMRVSPQLWNRLTEAGVIHVDLQRVRVADQSPLVQCSRCLGYGHSKRLCNETTEVCSHCGGPHLRTECADWLSGELPSCRNCLRAKMDRKDHNAFSSDCPANLQRSELATAELIIEATLKKISFALVQEPYIGRIGEMKSYPGTRIIQCYREPNTEKVIKAAIVLFDDTINITQCPGLTTENIAVARLRTGTWEMGVVSVYLESDKPIDPYLDTIEKAVEALGTGSVIVGGDVNAWNTWWGSREADVRGIDVAAKLDELELHILNEGTEPTFDTIRGGKRFSSCVDITTCSTSLLGRVENWRLSEEITSSDHRAILFDINLEKSVGIDIERKTRKYNTKKANWSEFREKLLQIWSNKQINKIEIDKIEMREELEIKIAEVTKTITELCDNTLPKLKHKKRMGLPWWTDELTQRKKEVSRLKRRISYAAPIRREWVVEQYLNAKEGYQQEVKRAQTSSWKDFCSKQDRESMWDGIYRVIGRTTQRQEDTPLVLNGKTMGNEESAKTLAEIFYPEDDTQEDDAGHRLIRETARVVNEVSHDDSCDPPFTMEELMWSVSSFNPKKAPGNDGLTADICEAAIASDPKLFLAIANKCLSLAYFPKKWKEAVVVVLRKPGKESYTHPKSYRPIGLLPVLGKIYEKMLIQRIKWHIVPKISPTQYGFMPQRSTEDSLYDMVQHIKAKLKNKKLIVLISLDIEGAFDNAWWPAIRCRLAESGCPINLRRLTDNYFEDRAVRVRYAGAEWVKTTAKGCVQGSIGGPIFWNLLLDPLLKELSEKGEHCQAFADDVVLIFSGDRALEVQDRANAALAYVQKWGVRNKLRFAPHKTKAMVITNKIKYDSPLLKMGGKNIALSREIKILGLTIDDKLTFNTHIKNVCCKVQRLYSQLIRAAKINWGLNPGIIRTIYVAVTEPIIMYAASVWAPSTYKLKVKKQLDMAQRGFVQKIIKSYKTVSLHSALLLAGLLPLDLRVQEAASLYEIKKGFSQRVVGDRDVERKLEYSKTPHPANQTGLQFKCLGDSAEVDQHDNKCIKIYTDGSKIEGKVGAALSVWRHAVEISTRKLKLEDFCTVYQAELLAIFEATNYALRDSAMYCNIYSDSRSALQTVVQNVTFHPLAANIRKNISKIQKQGKLIKLLWVKAHAGLEGNERADELAKEAALKLKRKPNYDKCPISFVKRQIRLDSLDEWNRRYIEGETASVTKIYFPNAISAYPIIRKLNMDPLMVQMMTGHGGFSEYLHRFKCKESPSCACDPMMEESVLHIITECPIYSKERNNVEIELETKIGKDSICKIIGSKCTRIRFLNYCKLIANKVVNKNK